MKEKGKGLPASFTGMSGKGWSHQRCTVELTDYDKITVNGHTSARMINTKLPEERQSRLTSYNYSQSTECLKVVMTSLSSLYNR